MTLAATCKKLELSFFEYIRDRIIKAQPIPPLAELIQKRARELNLGKPIYQRYKAVGGVAIAPSVLLSLLFYGYATGRFSSRKIKKATYEDLGYRYVAGGLHPDHDTIAHFRKMFLPELQGLFVEILLLAKLAGVLKVGNLSLDGSKIHADASKSKAVSYGRLVELEKQLQNEVKQLFDLGEQADQGEAGLPEGLVIENEIAFRQERLENLAHAKTVLEARAKERYEQEKAEYDAKIKAREEKAKKQEKKPCCKSPEPPKEGPNDRLSSLSRQRPVQHSKSVDTLLGKMPAEPPADASSKEKMAYKLATEIGKEIYRLRKCTVEPVIGIIKEVLGFRQFSLRGLANAAGEWCLICLAFNLKRLHTLFLAHSLY